MLVKIYSSLKKNLWLIKISLWLEIEVTSYYRYRSMYVWKHFLPFFTHAYVQSDCLLTVQENISLHWVLMRSPKFNRKLKLAESIWHPVLTEALPCPEGQSIFKELRSQDALKPKWSFLWLRSDQGSYSPPRIRILDSVNWPHLPKASLGSQPTHIFRVLLKALKTMGVWGWRGLVHPMAGVPLPRPMWVACFVASFYWAKYRKCHHIKYSVKD